MKPTTSTELEVEKLHAKLPEINKRQQQWAVRHCLHPLRAHTYRGRKTDVEHFIIATTRGEWQVLRSFYMYATFRRGQLAEVSFLEVMQEWFCHGRYVFYSCSRQTGYCNDAWTSQPMSIKHGTMGGYVLTDPRLIDYEGIRIERLTSQFRYTPTDTCADIRRAFRAVNLDPYAEIILDKCPSVFNWCFYRSSDVLPSTSERIAAVRVALRHRYDTSSPEWRDLVDMLIAEHLDIHSPHYVCPPDLHAAHDTILRRRIRHREEETRRLNEQLAIERAKRDKKMSEQYIAKRAKFFGLIFSDGHIQIQALKSVEEFALEGAAMHHCVYDNRYYDLNCHPDSLILSAKTIEGERLETIEVSLDDYSIVQSRAIYNGSTPQHQDILRLMNDHMDEIRRAAV